MDAAMALARDRGGTESSTAALVGEMLAKMASSVAPSATKKPRPTA